MREPVLPPGVPEPLDQELLAWAAGFFDGEGTTIARAEKRRPEYFRLYVTVPQASANGAAPTVLAKFRRAMLGVGTIYREADDLFRWRATRYAGAELCLALMWRWLGSVKRRQAEIALERIEEQYAHGTYARRRSRHRLMLAAHPSGSSDVDQRRAGLAWAAGFLDAEGWFGVTKLPPRQDGTSALRIRVSASQHGEPGLPPEVLIRLRDTLRVGRIERHGEVDDFKWVTQGEMHTRDVLETLLPWLGEAKVGQALVALDAHHVARVRGDSERCVRGHAYDGIYLRPDGTIHRRCSACDEIRDEARRARSRRLGEAVEEYVA